MSEKNYLVVLVILAMTVLPQHDVAASAFSGCSLGTQRVVSYDNTLLPPAAIKASSEDSVFNPDDNLFHRNSVPLRLWCTESTEEQAARRGGTPEPTDNNNALFNITINFTVPLLLTEIVTSGFSNGFVTNFSIAYSTSPEGELVDYYRNPDDGTKEFLASHIDSVFSLDIPLSALRLRLDIHDGILTPSGRLCWHLVLIGCTLEEALPARDEATAVVTTQQSTLPSLPLCIQPTTTTVVVNTHEETASTHASSTTVASTVATAMTASFPAETIVSSPDQDATITTEPSNNDNNILLLEVTIPTAVGTVLTVLCIVVAGVLVCLLCSGPNSKWRGTPKSNIPAEAFASTDTLGMVDNEIYKSRSSLFPVAVNCVDSLATEPHGGNNIKNTVSSSQGIYENCASVSFSYNKESGYHELSQLNRTIAELEQSMGSMVDNPNYSVPFPHTQGYCPYPLEVMAEEPSSLPTSPLFPPNINDNDKLTTDIAVKASIMAKDTTKSKARGKATKGTVGRIDMVDNTCYSVPSSIPAIVEQDSNKMMISHDNRHHQQQQHIRGAKKLYFQKTRNQCPPVDYETPKNN